VCGLLLAFIPGRILFFLNSTFLLILSTRKSQMIAYCLVVLSGYIMYCICVKYMLEFKAVLSKCVASTIRLFAGFANCMIIHAVVGLFQVH